MVKPEPSLFARSQKTVALQPPAQPAASPVLLARPQKKAVQQPAAQPAPLPDDMHSVVIIGNPGVGKSTTVNCWLQKLLFKAQVSSNGRGVTKGLSVHISGNVRYMDTPGLSDDTLRKAAAESISRALRHGGRFQVIFMLNGAASGRLQTDDLTTMKLVLEACDQLGEDDYAVMVNKCSAKFLKKLDREEWVANLLTCLKRKGAPTTRHILFAKSIDELDEEEDVIVSLPSETLAFLTDVPTINVHAPTVRDVDHLAFEDHKQAFEEEKKKTQAAVAKARAAVQIADRAVAAQSAAETRASAAEAEKEHAFSEARKAARCADQAVAAKTAAETAKMAAETRAAEAVSAKKNAERAKTTAERAASSAEDRASAAEDRASAAEDRASAAEHASRVAARPAPMKSARSSPIDLSDQDEASDDEEVVDDESKVIFGNSSGPDAKLCCSVYQGANAYGVCQESGCRRNGKAVLVSLGTGTADLSDMSVVSKIKCPMCGEGFDLLNVYFYKCSWVTHFQLDLGRNKFDPPGEQTKAMGRLSVSGDKYKTFVEGDMSMVKYRKLKFEVTSN